MIINVRPIDISNARESKDGGCPIESALWREHRKRVPCMAADWIWIDGLGDCGLPRAAQKFMAAFDRGRDVKPMRFELPLSSANGRRRIA